MMIATHRHFVRTVLAGILLLLGGALGPGAGAQASAVTSSSVAPVDFTAYYDCAGEEIHFAGEFHVVSHLTLDAGGGFVSRMHFNNQGVSGVGLTTGTRYTLSNTHNFTFVSADPLPAVFSHTHNMHLVGQGAAADQVFRVTYHTTFDANGESTSSVFNLAAGCE